MRTLLVLFCLIGCAGASTPDPPATPPSTREDPMVTLTVTSPAFEAGKPIPTRFTCEGANVSPALQWTGLPAGAKSIAVIVDDPDAPVGTWNHWVLWNVPPTATGLEEGSHEGVSGTSDFKRPGYGGPCPPKGHGAHRYFFKVFALDTTLDLPVATRRKALETAMKGHVSGKGELMGTYSRG